MARRNGWFNRALEFIGLVDDTSDEREAEEYDTRAEERSGSAYGPDPYDPQRYRPRPNRSSEASRRSREARSSDYDDEPPNAPDYARNRWRDSSTASRRTSSSAGHTAKSYRDTPEEATPIPTRTVIYEVRALDDCCSIINDLVDGTTVLLNTEKLTHEVAQRVIDTIVGASFALNAELRKASDHTYLVAPRNVKVKLGRNADGSFR